MQIDLDTLCMASTAEPIAFFTSRVLSAYNIGKNILSVGSRIILEIVILTIHHSNNLLFFIY
jgi:hypothetical protein